MYSSSLFCRDSLLFCRANLREWRIIQALLERYEGALGQQLNKDKTSLFFSHNTGEADRNTILQGTGLVP
jgi:hypothetical protein